MESSITPSPTPASAGPQRTPSTSGGPLSAGPYGPGGGPPGETHYTGLYPIKDDACHVIAASAGTGRLEVWDLLDQRPIRILTGLQTPKDLKLIDRYRAVVLCNRELKVYNTDTGQCVVKLKGVMNQKMPFYGLQQGSDFLVALSRNRMYVNLMSTTTGDLVTTFKVGEDRFLDSLLVSSAGGVCVCGDETQKPFPLLVWDLAARKLIYDLRLPHHEFITRISAISDDGHFVVCACKQLNSTAANFIIVYDLHSGTMFNKWKPDVATTAVGISSTGGCVVQALADGDILVWDLFTGDKKFTLSGHAQGGVDTLQINESGTKLLSVDSKCGADKSIRVWSLTEGSNLAVFTPDEEVTCTCLSSEGSLVVVALKGSSDSSTTDCSSVNGKIKIYSIGGTQEEVKSRLMTERQPYGDESRTGQQFDLSKD